MQRRCFVLTVLACVLIAMSVVSAATQEIRSPIPAPDPTEDPEGFIRQRTRCADLVITGIVSEVDDRVIHKGGYYTVVTVDVDSVLRGTLDGPSLTFFHHGGVSETLVQISPDQTAFLPKQEVLLFLWHREFWGPVYEGQTLPDFMLASAEDHYVLADGAVWRGGRARVVREGGVKRFVPELGGRPLYSRQFMLGEIGNYMTSILPESLTVRAQAVVVGEVLGRQPGTEGADPNTDIIEFRNDAVVKGTVPESVIRIRIPSVPGRIACYYDQPAFPVGQRMVVFLGESDGTYRLPIEGYAASRAVANEGDEQTLLERIRAATR